MRATRSSCKPSGRYCRHGRWELDGIAIFQDRVVMLEAFRVKTMDALHAAHHGVTLMERAARTLVFWPGLSNDLK